MRLRYLVEFAALVPVLAIIAHWLAAVAVTLIRGRARKCPRCLGRTRWSRVRIHELVLPAFVLPRRCESCHARFYAARPAKCVHTHAARFGRPEPAPGFVPAAAQPRLR